MFNLAHVILKNPNDKVKVRTPHSWTCLFLYSPFILPDDPAMPSTCRLTRS